MEVRRVGSSKSTKAKPAKFPLRPLPVKVRGVMVAKGVPPVVVEPSAQLVVPYSNGFRIENVGTGYARKAS
jgi:hypothetical protein